jgi:hypothetical protein
MSGWRSWQNLSSLPLAETRNKARRQTVKILDSNELLTMD